jgi:cell surface protein SprA
VFNKRRFFYYLVLSFALFVYDITELKSQDLSIIVEEETADTLHIQELKRFFRPVYGDFVARPFYTPIPALYFITLPEEQTGITRRSDGGFYIVRKVGEVQSGAPTAMSFQEFAVLHRQYSVEENWSQLIFESRLREERQRGLLDFSLTIPGGRQSAFTTIFGKPEVNLRVNGVAQMNVGASVQRSEDPSLPPDQQTRVDPTFDQSLQLNIQGTIGDKLTIQTDWDTERTFDYQNRLNIVYQGYDDEIIKTIEMGNVSMNTGNSLIRGSGALFGIKSVAELGSFRFTTVVSQQDGESNVETIRGGSQERVIQLRPADYSDDRHFFLISLRDSSLKQVWPTLSNCRSRCKLRMLKFGFCVKTFRLKQGQDKPLR